MKRSPLRIALVLVVAALLLAAAYVYWAGIVVMQDQFVLLILPLLASLP